MAYSTIPKPSVYFNTKLYTGNSSTNAITGVGFQPDWVWIKNRGANDSHYLYDAVRGVTKSIYSNLTTAEATKSNGLTAFGTDGFTLGNEGDINGNGNNFVSWNWKCETGVSGTTTGSGSSRSYSGRVNTTAGISIINYAGNSTSGHTIPHNLGAVPKIVMLKNLGDTGDWIVHMGAINDPEKVTSLNTTDAATNFNAGFNTTTPTSSVFTLGNSVAVNDDNQQYIAYCFAEKKGYSKFGKYIGNGNADGTFVYTGFKPAFVMAKATTDSGQSWLTQDNKRNTFNLVTQRLFANLTNADSTNSDGGGIDFVSNGFKIRTNDGSTNASGQTRIYMAFAEEPLVANVGQSIPATAR